MKVPIEGAPGLRIFLPRLLGYSASVCSARSILLASVSRVLGICLAGFVSGSSSRSRAACICTERPAMPTRASSWSPRLAIDFPEYDIDRSQYCRDVGQNMASAQEIHGLQVRKARRPELAAIGAIGAVGDEIDAELALRRLDGDVYLSGRHVIALGVELEVLDQSLHRAFHQRPLRRHHLVVH